jgi:hypothetical protein
MKYQNVVTHDVDEYFVHKVIQHDSILVMIIIACLHLHLTNMLM